MKVADVLLAATVTEAGTDNMDGALSESVTTVLPVAGFEKVTVQVVLELEARLAAPHWRPESVTVTGDNTRESVAYWDEPFNVAVMVAVCCAVKARAVARNVPLPEPEGIVNEGGTVRLVELELRPMIPPPDPLRITVQVLEAYGAKPPGLHAMELTAAATLTVPPAPVMAIASPVSEALRLLLMVTGTPLLPDRVTDTVATIPLEMILEFSPHATHVYEPTPPAQDRVLPAEDNAVPGATPMLATLEAG